MRIALRSACAAVALVGAFVACSDSADDVPPLPARDAGSDVDATPVVPSDENRIPCAPRAVLQTVCQQCHSRPTKAGAPFSLVNRSDIVALRGSVETRQLMIEQVTSGRMPLAPATIDDADRSVLLAWLEAGAPASEPDACEGEPDAGTDASDDAGSDAGDEGGADAGSDAEPDAS